MSVWVFNNLVVTLLFKISLRMLVAALVVWLLLKLYNTKNSAVLHFVWLAVLIGMLLFPFIYGLVPYISVPILPATARLPATDSQFIIWLQLAAITYFTGVGVMLTRFIIGLFGIQKMIRQSQIIESAELSDYLQRIGTKKNSQFYCRARLSKLR